MMVLPSGRVIDLSTDRAKYHALRQPGVDAASTHRKLYSLVDIIYRNIDDAGNPKRGWTEYDYNFSGYTLNTVQLANDWSETDKKALFHWLQEKDQQRRIETARRRLNDNQQHLSVKSYSSPQHLYSLLRNRLINSPLQRASAEQWYATIINMKQRGLREEEIQWSGLVQYLKRMDRNTLISKTQLLENFTQGNQRLNLSIEQLSGNKGGLCFEEVAFRMPHQAVYRAALKLDTNCLCILRFIDNAFNYRIGVIKTLINDHHMALNKYWFAFDSYGRAISNDFFKNNKKTENLHFFFENSLDAKFAADKHAREHLEISKSVKTNTYFDHFTLYGGTDYREWFVTLPDYQRIYFGPHFYDHNVLVHIRTTTRTEKAGRKILFIEEIQSDWHQSAKQSGYTNSSWGKVANAPFKQEWLTLAVKLMLIQASKNGFEGIAWPDGNIQELRYKRNLHSIAQYYDHNIPKAINRLGKNFNCKIDTTKIDTRDPWLNLERSQDKWRVADSQGKFKTKAKYNSRDEAMAVIARHCRRIELEVSVFFINKELCQHIAEKGLPLYGHTIK